MSDATTKPSTRERILAAARTEFARHGIAGARIDRIATAAKTSKERVYTYFRSKEELHKTLSAAELTVAVEATDLDPKDLPTYAGQLFDHFTRNPEHLRLVSWGRLEQEDTEATRAEDPAWRSIVAKRELLRDAQLRGELTTEWDALDILMLVNHLATAWFTSIEMRQLVEAPDSPAVIAERRDAIVRAVARLFPSTA